MWVISMKRALLGLLFSSAAFACQEAPFETVPFTTLERGQYGAHAPAQQYVFRDQALWEKHYKAYHSDKVPVVDFSKEMVLGVYLGQKPNSAYHTEIKEIRKLPDELDVLVENSGPQPGKMYLQVITHPYHLVKTEKTDKEILWTPVTKQEKK